MYLAAAIVAMATALLPAAAGPGREVQNSAGAEKAIRLDLGMDRAEPGGEVTVPIVLDAPEGIAVGKTINEITFPRGVLKFREATPGIAAEVAGAKVQTAVQEGEAESPTSRLTVTVTSAGNPIRSGIVALIVFDVPADADASEPVKLANVPRAFTPGTDGRPIEPITGQEGEIGFGPPVIACFFYMH